MPTGTTSSHIPIHRKNGPTDPEAPPAGGNAAFPTAPAGDAAEGAAAGASDSIDESKYGKRRHQKLQQRTRRALVLMAASLCLLTFTYWRVRGGAVAPGRGTSTVTSAGRGDDDNDGGSGGARPRRRGEEAAHEPRGGGRATNRRGQKKKARNGKRQRVRHQEFPQGDDGKEEGDDAEEEGDDGSDGDDANPGDDASEQDHGNLKRAPKTDERRMRKLEEDLHLLEERIQTNRNNGIRWVNPGLVPPLREGERKPMLEATRRDISRYEREQHTKFFNVRRSSPVKMAWEVEDLAKAKQVGMRHGFVDYTKHSYRYPEKLVEPPTILGEYPKLTPMKDLMEIWPQDDLDHPPATIEEDLIHFDYNKPHELEAARKFRDAKLPFKLVNVPEVVAAGGKWTDEYLTINFDGEIGSNGPRSKGSCQESPDNFFAFHQREKWRVETLGLPPTRSNHWTYAKWAQHARYADKVGLNATQPHFYFESGVDKEERHKDKKRWSFVSRDLPSFTSPSETFFVFEPDEQKGIQCRFGERGVTAATHYDMGRNMVAMVTGAKRYILSPPRECSKLGIVNNYRHTIFRHSMLNFGHLSYINRKDMPQEERQWMILAGTAGAISTVLKAGEVLYIPSHWFHYIISLQKSAQCNVRSGVDEEGDSVYGGASDVMDKCDAVLSS